MIIGGLVAAAVVDLCRAPPDQFGGRLYVVLVRGYQGSISPCLRGFVRCRYSPSCSEYSIEAVKQCGLWKGLGLTVSRLWRCRGTVPLGTCDPVPDTDADCSSVAGPCQQDQSAE